jgi:3-methyladenine DNA glycosylase AlkD
MNLFCYTPFVEKKIYEYALNKKEFIRRTAFTLIACLACRKKDLKDKDLIPYFSLIKEYSFDERNFVKKAVN